MDGGATSGYCETGILGIASKPANEMASAAREVPSSRLGELVMRELKRIDKVAYVRFASVYRSFEDVDEFRRLIRDI